MNAPSAHGSGWGCLPSVPGFLAVSWRTEPPTQARISRALEIVGAAPVALEVGGRTRLYAWASPQGNVRDAFLFSRSPRLADEDLSVPQVAQMLRRRDAASLRSVMPTFAAVALDEGKGLTAVTDALGFRHLYTAEGDGWVAVSTSARILALLNDATIDHSALAIQSLLGWQLSDRTLHDGVRKVPAGTGVTISFGRAIPWVYATQGLPDALPADEAVAEASLLLREYLNAYLDDHPDAVLQLTGGQDSRILLSAIDPSRRPSVPAMTLAVPGSDDAVVAAKIAQGQGMRHDVVPVPDFRGLSSATAFTMCVAASIRLEGMADPVAAAAISVVESQLPQGRRVSGLGGEVARGFYYLGSSRYRPVTMRRVQRLTAWRMFANEAASADLFTPDFASWAHSFAVNRVHQLLLESGCDWLTSTDEFYLWQRMQRWAGVVDTSVCYDRDVVDPMLDARFVRIARALSPADKYGSRFLARLQVALDPGLASIPLDSRPAPVVYARGGWRASTHVLAATGQRVVRKASQRALGRRRPVAGAAILSRGVIEHWRHRPDLLAGVAALDIVDTQWLDAVLAGRINPDAATVALLLNLQLVVR